MAGWESSALLTYPNQRVLYHEYSSGTDDNLSRVSYLSETNAGGTRYVEYARLGLGQFVRADFHRAGANDPVLRWNLAFGAGSDPYDGLDAFGRVKDHRWTNYAGTSDKVKIGHGYDRAGNRLWRKDDVAAAQNPAVYLDELYTDDGVYQLKDRNRGQLNANKDGLVSNTKNFAEAWTLDATGNWSNFKQDATGGGWTLDQDREHNKANEIAEIEESSAHVAHDRAGNMTRAPKPSDWSSHYHLVYDAWNRLVKVLDADGETLVAEYAYDGRNFRVLKKTYDVEGELSETRHFYYMDDWRLLEERVEDQEGIARQNVWGLRYIDDLVLRDWDSDGDGDTEDGNLGVSGSGLDRRLYALQDANWNVVAIADTTGVVQERYTYTAYGKVEIRHPDTFVKDDGAARALGWTILYTGRDLDPETGLQINRNRYLHLDLGRFIVVDPKEYDGEDFNLYRYVGGNPAIGADPHGTIRITEADAHYKCTKDEERKIRAAANSIMKTLEQAVQGNHEVFASSPGKLTKSDRAFFNAQPAVQDRCRTCRQQLPDCIIKTLQSEIWVRCETCSRGGNATGYTKGTCVDSKGELTKIAAPSCGPCTGDQLERSTITLCRGNIDPRAHVTNPPPLNSGTAPKDLLYTFVHEIIHNCVGATEYTGGSRKYFTVGREGAHNLAGEFIDKWSAQLLQTFQTEMAARGR